MPHQITDHPRAEAAIALTIATLLLIGVAGTLNHAALLRSLPLTVIATAALPALLLAARARYAAPWLARLAIGELLVVGAILGVASTSEGPFNRNIRAAIQLHALQAALDEYFTDHGSYPPSDDDLSSRPLVIYLDGDPANGGPDKRYQELGDWLDADGRLLDPWGRPLHYRENRRRLELAGVEARPEIVRDANGAPIAERSGAIDWQRFDLWSSGCDPDDPADDVGSWRRD